jgi:G:T-mismatch repair DNA endonuclease (very short patch repair protein)
MSSINSNDHVSFSVAKKRLHEFFEKFVPTNREYCINPDCVKDTEAAVLYIYGRLIHWHMSILNGNQR